MGTEAFPTTQTVELSPEQTEQAELLQANFGLSWEEGQQEVQAGKYRGTLAEMLLDPECPVGGPVENAYKNAYKEAQEKEGEEAAKKNGKEAVQRQLDSLKTFFPDFNADVGKRFVATEAKKKLNQSKI